MSCANGASTTYSFGEQECIGASTFRGSLQRGCVSSSEQTQSDLEPCTHARRDAVEARGSRTTGPRRLDEPLRSGCTIAHKPVARLCTSPGGSKARRIAPIGGTRPKPRARLRDETQALSKRPRGGSIGLPSHRCTIVHVLVLKSPAAKDWGSVRYRYNGYAVSRLSRLALGLAPGHPI